MAIRRPDSMSLHSSAALELHPSSSARVWSSIAIPDIHAARPRRKRRPWENDPKYRANISVRGMVSQFPTRCGDTLRQDDKLPLFAVGRGSLLLPQPRRILWSNPPTRSMTPTCRKETAARHAGQNDTVPRSGLRALWHTMARAHRTGNRSHRQPRRAESMKCSPHHRLRDQGVPRPRKRDISRAFARTGITVRRQSAGVAHSPRVVVPERDLRSRSVEPSSDHDNFDGTGNCLVDPYGINCRPKNDSSFHAGIMKETELTSLVTLSCAANLFSFGC